MPDHWYADVVAQLAPYGCKVAIDTSDGPLAALVDGFDRAAPDLIKPNAEGARRSHRLRPPALEAAVAQGDPEPVVSAAQELVNRGVGAVLATLGAAGAVLVNHTGSWLATPPPIAPRSTVGAGDSALAGYLRADVDGAEPPQRLQMAVAYGRRRGRTSWFRSAYSSRGRRQRRSGYFDFTDFTHPHQPHRYVTTNRKYRHDQHRFPAIIDPDLVLLDVDAGADKQAVIGRLVGRLADAGRTTDPDGLTAAAMAREEQSATGLPGGIAIPHCRSPHVDTASIGFARLRPPVDFGAPDGPADLAFLIAAPEAGGAEHMKLLSSLARALVRKEFVASLREASTPADVVTLVDEVLNPAEKPKAAAPAEKAAAEKPKTLVAITACPTGIAHTYMAADSLVAAAKEAGVTLHVETQGSSGSTPLDPSTIAAADAVIFATDVGVKDKQRFAGKPVIASGVKRAINEPDKMVAEAVSAAANNPNATRVEGVRLPRAPRARAPAGERRLGRQHPARSCSPASAT